MSKQGEREQFVATMTKEGLTLAEIRAVLRGAASLQRIAELECSSEAADRDRVPCPATVSEKYECCCDFGYQAEGKHGDTPRVTAKSKRIEYLITQLLKPTGVRADFQGDPRGFVVKLHVPSGRDEGWGGVGVPA
jgi:hypothetical protein